MSTPFTNRVPRFRIRRGAVGALSAAAIWMACCGAAPGQEPPIVESSPVVLASELTGAASPNPEPALFERDRSESAPRQPTPATLAPVQLAPADAVPVMTQIRTADLQEIFARLESLERQVAAQQEPKPAKPSGKGDGQGGDGGKKPDDGWVDVSSEKWTLRMGGHVQTDLINWADASPSIPNTYDYFEFRRLRLVAEGTGYGTFDFRLQMTLEPETIGESAPGIVMSPDVKDAYFSVNDLPLLGRFRIGNFFVPFSLEQVTNDTNNVFLERSIPTQGVFAVDREVGMAFYNTNEAKSVTWTTGIFIDNISDSIKERLDDNQGYRVAGRLTWVPYYDEPSNGRYMVHTGVGALYTVDHDERVRFRSRPQIHEGPRIIDSGILNAKSYLSSNLEGAVVWGSVTFQSEAFLTTVNLNSGDTAITSGAYAHLSYFLTGENRIYERFGQHGAQFGRNQPYSNFFWVPGAFSIGALEAKARWSHLDLNDVQRGQYNDFTIGLNWYWSDRTRVMFDWIHPITSSTAIFGATHSDILAFRFDFNW